MPSARATGWMSKAQVARTLERSRDLPRRVQPRPGRCNAAGGRRRAIVTTSSPHQSDVQKFLTTSLTSPSRKNNPLLLFSRFDRTKARLVGDVIKTRGRVTYEEGERGAVEVRTDVTYDVPGDAARAGQHRGGPHDRAARGRDELGRPGEDRHGARHVLRRLVQRARPTEAVTPPAAVSSPSSAPNGRRATARPSTRTTAVRRWTSG